MTLFWLYFRLAGKAGVNILQNLSVIFFCLLAPLNRTVLWIPCPGISMTSLILFQFSTISRLILHKYSSHSLGGACLQMMFEIFWLWNLIKTEEELMQFQHVPHLCHIAVFFSDVFFCNLFALNFYPNTSEDKFWNLSISWFSFSGQLEPTIFNYSLAFCLFLMGESCASLNMYKT